MPSSQKITESVHEWQSRLLQLDRRNALLYFPMGKRGVTLRNMTPDMLLERLASSRSGLTFLYAERVRTPKNLFELAADSDEQEPPVHVRPGNLDTDLAPLELQKRLSALSKRSREWREEQGLNVLFIALGFLHWVDEDEMPACSPILLAPCDLTRSSPREPYALGGDELEDLVVNSTLRHALMKTAGIDLPEVGETTVVDYLTEVAQLVVGREGWRVEPHVVVATFPFSKLAMWEDLNLMLSTGVTHPLVRRLAGDTAVSVGDVTTGSPPIPVDDTQLHGALLDDLLDVRDQYAVVDADFSQLRAIELARSGTNVVIHGPPGTGKSQTIANIIATLIAEGHRVLFVSEKTAALDVVKRRLTDIGLGGFCLDLHSERGKKDSVYAQLHEALSQSPPQVQEFPYDRLLARRHELNTTVRALHELRQPLGLSVFAVHGRVSAIHEVPQLNVLVPDIENLSSHRLGQIQDAAQRIARFGPQFREHYASRWRALGDVSASPMLAHDLRTDLASISSAVDSLLDAARNVSTACGVNLPMTQGEVDHILPLLDHLNNFPGSIPRQWLQSGGLERAQVSTEALRKQTEERSTLINVLLFSLCSLPTQSQFRQWRDTALADIGGAIQWQQIAGPAWGKDLLIDPESTANVWRTRAMALDLLVDASMRLQALLGVTHGLDSGAAAESATIVAQKLLRVGKIPAPWSGTDAITAIRAQVGVTRRLRDEMVGTESALAESFGPEIVELVDEHMLVRYRTDYRSLWRRLGTSYRRDARIIRGCLKHSRKISIETATVAIGQALTVRRLRAVWPDSAARVEVLLGARYKGLDSDWSGIESDLDSLIALDREFAAQEPTFHSILSDARLLADLKTATQTVVDRIETLDRLWPQSSAHRSEHIPEISATARSLAEVSDRVGVVMVALAPFVRPPANLEDLVELLKVGARFEEIEVEAAALADTRAKDIGDSFNAWATEFDALQLKLDWTQALVTLLPLPTPLKDWVSQPHPPNALLGKGTALAGAAIRWREAGIAAAPRLPAAQTPWKTWETAPLQQVQAWCDDLSAHAEEANDWVEYRTATLALDAAVGVQVTSALKSVTEDATAVPSILLRHVYLSWLKYIYGVVPELRFSPRDIEGVQRDFKELDARLPKSARERVKAKCLAVYPSGASLSNGMGELGVLNHELAKRRRRLPVRKLVARIPNLLQKLKPVFMMSPLAVSQYLPRGVSESETLGFDTVIFDEASQVFPEDAVPAIARGRQSIVVGDRQQLPPTSFFRKGEEDDETDDAPETENQFAGMESILDVMVGMVGAGVNEVDLRVHYRSQHDALIRYSNHYFYDDRLLTFPSAYGSRPGLGIRDIYLPDARFEAGGSRTNRKEAERVAQMVFELMESQPPSESIGVVALSRPQADLIQDLIDQYRLSDSRFDARFSVESHEPFFVKNLENVQGDERDHMILSIGYGPTTGSGVVPNRFGPINAEGGHRRLNVAVSRARRSMTVIHSLRAEDIHSETNGARLLRRYLEFLDNREGSIEGVVTSVPEGEAESPFEEAVGRALERRGYRIQRQVGCANYWIDIAVMSEDGSSYDLGIECDGATYHRSPSARDRDRLRQEILEKLGWRGRIHRVWSTAWIRNPQAEITAIERAIQRARSMSISELVTARTEVSLNLPPTRTPQPESDSPRPSLVAPVADSIRLKPYIKADLQRFPKSHDLRVEDRRRIAQLVIEVAKTEGPVHTELVVERIREHCGFGRAGRRVRDAVLAGVYAAFQSRKIVELRAPGSIENQDEFFIAMSGGTVEPRGPAQDGTVRKIDHLCDQEIDAAIAKVVTAMVGATKEEVVIATARAFGYARTGSLVEDRISGAVDRLLAAGRLKDRLGSLVLAN